YDTLEGVLENADKIKGALGEKVRNGKESAIISKMLATIITDVPVAFDYDKYLVREINKDVLREIFAALEFRTVGARILGETIAAPAESAKARVQSAQGDLFGAVDAYTPSEYATIETNTHLYELLISKEEIEGFVATALQQSEICIDT